MKTIYMNEKRLKTKLLFTTVYPLPEHTVGHLDPLRTNALSRPYQLRINSVPMETEQTHFGLW